MFFSLYFVCYFAISCQKCTIIACLFYPVSQTVQNVYILQRKRLSFFMYLSSFLFCNTLTFSDLILIDNLTLKLYQVLKILSYIICVSDCPSLIFETFLLLLSVDIL